MAKTYNLFISHSWTYTDAYEKLCNLLNNADDFSYHNHSVPKDDPIHTDGTVSELEQAIQNHMSGCHVVLIMAGKYSTYSKWIKKEIKLAQEGFENAKPIIGVKPWGNTQVSSVVQDAADEMVGWNTKSIVDAIRKLG
ncbi:MAG: TIR domain-containing protein, partial [Dehalococcoidales bacterium]|nr:TIR domain-containing protein [Dehalococcoidales bacterium]